ncbi:hypothetical protein B0H13DRAFT_1911125 [Mycena leptocephala]|nr:hypothetical protein B0H13DRAFT_1911125 [Mycena leptocephala]
MVSGTNGNESGIVGCSDCASSWTTGTVFVTVPYRVRQWLCRIYDEDGCTTSSTCSTLLRFEIGAFRSLQDKLQYFEYHPENELAVTPFCVDTIQKMYGTDYNKPDSAPNGIDLVSPHDSISQVSSPSHSHSHSNWHSHHRSRIRPTATRCLCIGIIWEGGGDGGDDNIYCAPANAVWTAAAAAAGGICGVPAVSEGADHVPLADSIQMGWNQMGTQAKGFFVALLFSWVGAKQKGDKETLWLYSIALELEGSESRNTAALTTAIEQSCEWAES